MGCSYCFCFVCVQVQIEVCVSAVMSNVTVAVSALLLSPHREATLEMAAAVILMTATMNSTLM